MPVNKHNLRYEFIDICTPDYLVDHHSRKSEQLIAVSYYGDMNCRELADEVVREVLYGGNYESLWAVLPRDDEDAEVLLRQRVIDGTSECDLTGMPENDEVQVYGYFTWDSDDLSI